MDANIFGNIGLGIAQGLERGTQNAYNIQNQGMSQRLQIQKMAEDSQYKQQMLSMSQDSAGRQQKEFEAKMREYDMKFAVQDQYAAFEAYSADGDVSHLNRLLAKSPLTKERANAVRFEKLNPTEQADTSMLAEKFGLDVITPAVSKNYVKAIRQDGSVDIMPMTGLYIATGYATTKDKERRAKLMEDAELAHKEAQTAKENAMAEKYANGGGAEDTAMQKNYNFLNRRDPKLGEDYLKKETGWAPTSQTKEGLELEKVKKELPTDFFDKTYVPGTPEYRELEPKVQKIEKLAGIKLDSTTRKEISNLKQIITLADPAAKLTDADTGLIDNTFGNIGKYISDKSPAEAKSAYNQIMTSIRNATYGATLPAAEMSAFANAYGTLYQQIPAIRDSLRTALKGVQAKLDAYAYVGDEAVSHFRFGADEKKLNGIIDNLQGLIDATEAKEPGKKVIKPNIPLPNKALADGASYDYKTPPPAPRNSVKEYTDGTRAKNPQTGEMLVYRTGKGWVAE